MRTLCITLVDNRCYKGLSKVRKLLVRTFYNQHLVFFATGIIQLPQEELNQMAALFTAWQSIREIPMPHKPQLAFSEMDAVC
jgi:hypothetical protein